ncbi:MAG: hypothetical protein LBU12_06355, partial [Deltaproteobacteria bacterium]|nr:hypothetical protein [Deltaproteobacteria bacterium]
MSLFAAFNRAAFGLFQLLKGPAGSFCRWETADDPLTLATDDGSLLSAFAVEGTLARADDEAASAAAVLAEKTRTLLDRPGRFVSAAFAYDPAGAAREIARSFRPMHVTAQECSLALGGVLSDWERSLVERCGAESLIMTLWTTQALLPDLERRRAGQAARRAAAELGATFGRPPAGRQREDAGLAALREAHQGGREVLAQALAAAGLSAEPVTARRLVRDVRLALDARLTPEHWRPLLPGDPRPLSLPEPGEAAGVSLFYPSLASQLFPSEATTVGGDLVKIGGRLHAPFVMSLPPRSPKPFSELFASLARGGRRDPLRLTMNLAPDGFAGLTLKGALARILSFASPDNRRLAASLGELRRLADAGTAVVGFSLAFDTWLEVDDHPDLPAAARALRLQAGR